MTDSYAATSRFRVIRFQAIDGRGGQLVADEFEVHDPDAVDHEGIASLLGTESVPNAGTGERYRIELRKAEVDGWVRVDGPGAQGVQHVRAHQLGYGVLSRITRHYLDDPSMPLRLHGAAVAGPEQDGVVLLGSTGAGKSVLTAHLVAGGLALVSDEQISIHAHDQWMAGFSRPIAVKPSARPFLPDGCTFAKGSGVRLLRAVDLGGRYSPISRPRLVVELERNGHPFTEWKPLSSMEIAVAICRHHLDLTRRPAEALASVGWLASTTTAGRLTVSSSRDAAATVRELLAAVPSPSPPTSFEVWRTKEGQFPTSVEDGLITLEIGERALVFNPKSRRVVWLAPQGASAWKRLAAGMRVADAAFIDQLTELGLLRH